MWVREFGEENTFGSRGRVQYYRKYGLGGW